MRATARDVLRHPSWAGDWRADLPMRRRRWWAELLLAPGAGWLRWGGTEAWFRTGWNEPPDCGTVFPPARRAWLWLTRRVPRRELEDLVDPERGRLWL